MLRRIYHETVLKHRKTTSFIILLSFLLTFTVARLMVHLIDSGIMPDLYLGLGQTHVHHLNYGIFLLSVAGYCSLIFRSKKTIKFLSYIYGIGLGLTFDEFSLWLYLEDDYYARISYEAVVVIITLLINIIYFKDIWKKIFNYFLRYGKLPEPDKI